MNEQRTGEAVATVPIVVPVAATTKAAGSGNEPEREVRFAVVIYGGVSLAIYINGVVQEMLHMVRATAEGADVDGADGGKLTAVEKVYRKLGRIVGAPEEPTEVRRTIHEGAGAGAEQVGFLRDRPGKAGLRPEIRVAGIRKAVELKASAAARKAAVVARVDGAAEGRSGERDAGSNSDAGTKTDETDKDAARHDEHFLVDPAKPVRSRFVVDILSGTSAGGINAIFMAKALANNMSIDSLAEMWITQADLALLLNDEKVKPSSLRQAPVPSLLNSPWMYYQLLKALGRMNESKQEGKPLVEDLDLFCTTTDLRGLPMKIALTDESVKEQRYRNVYHFKRRALKMEDTRNKENHDFTVDMDPFLAFAARCTSSFPFAFEPMTLEDIVDPIKNDDAFRAAYWNTESTTEKASLFGPEVVKLKGAEKFAEICNVYRVADKDGHFANRPFGDGGYLNNKPFTYAIETLKKRHATLPVDRKLIYVEPGPEDVRDGTDDGKADRPTVIENSLDALLVLPRYETIRQNIESVVQWNSDIGRLHRVIGHIEEEIKGQMRGKQPENAPLQSSAASDSVSYSIYWRLRLSGTADGLACRLADALNVETDSAEGQSLRVISGEWRVRKFTGTVLNPDDREVQQRFLDFFDFDYCERSIRFLRGRLQHLPLGEERSLSLMALSRISAEFQGISEERLNLDLTEGVETPLEYLNCWRQYLQFIVDPRRAALVLGVPDECGKGREDGYRAEVLPAELKAMLSTSDDGRNARVRWLFSGKTEGKGRDRSEGILVTTNAQNQLVAMAATGCVGFDAIVSKVADVAIRSYAAPVRGLPVAKDVPEGAAAVAGNLSETSDRSGGYYSADARPPFTDTGIVSRLEQLHDDMVPLFEAIEMKPTDAAAAPTLSGREFFKRQDVQVYPVIFGTTLGEFEQVEMFRISPQDTREIARTNPPGAQSRPPLRGASLANFGAFLDQDWRLSDMLSGRLDGAERLITSVLPDSDAETVRWREHMIKEAQEAIAEEWVGFVAGLNLKRSAEKQTQVDLIMKKSVEEKKGGRMERLRWRLAKWINPAVNEPEAGPTADLTTPHQTGGEGAER